MESNIELDVLSTEYKKIESVLEARKRLDGGAYYVPNPIQFKAHSSVARTIGICAANRIGKSTWGTMELRWACFKDYPDYVPKARRFNRPIKAVISVESFDHIARVIEPKIVQLFPHVRYEVRRRGGYVTMITTDDGSVIHVLTLEMDDMAYEGFDIDLYWGDEPQNQRKREGLLRGLVDRQGYELLSFTPLTEAWMKDEIIDKADGKRTEIFFGDIRVNKYDINGNPILAEEAIQDFERSLPEEIREIRVEGRFFTLRGRVYKEFSTDVHVLDTIKYQWPDPVICVLDPHDRTPHHAIWAFIDRNDDVYVDFEMVCHAELPILAKKIKAIERERGYKLRKRIIDPNFGRKPSKPGSNVTVAQELGRHGAPFYDQVDDDETLGHMIVRDYLHYDRAKPVSATNCPKVFFARDRCMETIKSMRNLQYEDWRGRSKNERDPKEKEKDKETHGADCMRYLLISKPKFRFLHETPVYELEGAPY